MKLRRITSPGDEGFSQLMNLYMEAFPEEERRAVRQLEYLIQAEKSMYFNAIELDGDLAGFFIYWELGDFYYMEHLAVYAELRNKKIGQQVLDYIETHLKGERLLEVEHPENEMATRRIRYYERNGYTVVEKNYMQPSYDGKHRELPLWIMGNRNYEDQNLLAAHIEKIKNEVYIRYQEF